MKKKSCNSEAKILSFKKHWRFVLVSFKDWSLVANIHISKVLGLNLDKAKKFAFLHAIVHVHLSE